MVKISHDPIVIIGTPRSFTSLTAGIFRDHGVWMGRCKEYHEYAPTGSCENAKLKTGLKKMAGAGRAINGTLAPEVPGWRERIEWIMKEESYHGGPHAWKHSAMYYPVWHEFNPKFVCCRRTKEAVLKSGERTGMIATKPWEEHQKAMDDVVSAGKGVNVFGEKYFEGDWSDLEKAFEFCNLEFDKKIAENLIDHQHKHF